MYRNYCAKEAAQAERLLNQLRSQCQGKGLSGIKGLSVFFRSMDRDYSKGLTYSEFSSGLKKYGLDLVDDDMKFLFAHFDWDRSGYIDFREFLQELAPRMTPRRVAVIDEAFDKLDVIKDNTLRMDDLLVGYQENAKSHPKYQSGEWSMEQVLQSFLDAFDSPNHPDGVVTREEFHHYYSLVSATVDDDNLFDLQMRKTWGLPAFKGGKKAGTKT